MLPQSYMSFAHGFVWLIFILGLMLAAINFYIGDFRNRAQTKKEDEVKCKKDKE